MLYVFSMIYEFHFETLVFALYFNFGTNIVEIKIKIQTYFKSLVSNNKNMAVEKNFRVAMNFYKKHCLTVATWNKHILLKQIISITYTLEKRFFAVAILLKVFESFLFRQLTNLWYNLVCISLLWTSSKEKSQWILLMRSKFISLYLDSCLMCQSVNLSWENKNSKCWLCFHLFLWRAQK